MKPKLTNYAILKQIKLFYLKTEPKPQQEVSVDIYRASHKAYNNSLQICEKLHEFLPDCEKVFGPSQHLQVTQWMTSIDGKEKMMLSTSELRKNNPPPPKQVQKTAPIARSRNSNVKK
ncbi:hypothetical protein O181_053529 [Austropuccinia psidii MF-1]|uniref:Uncharacterized protein n=1 Tax=Austropuccinia psidii MF-1 TaxID=1389203 RepID=A0A9Q3E2U8_9BASI|nr:hypothetical protein [Austropuccinia psidii MF-1]